MSKLDSAILFLFRDRFSHVDAVLISLIAFTLAAEKDYMGALIMALVFLPISAGFKWYIISRKLI